MKKFSENDIRYGIAPTMWANDDFHEVGGDMYKWNEIMDQVKKKQPNIKIYKKKKKRLLQLDTLEPQVATNTQKTSMS